MPQLNRDGVVACEVGRDAQITHRSPFPTVINKSAGFLIQALKYRTDPLPHTDAHGGQSELPIVLLHDV